MTTQIRPTDIPERDIYYCKAHGCLKMATVRVCGPCLKGTPTLCDYHDKKIMGKMPGTWKKHTIWVTLPGAQIVRDLML